MTLQTNIKKRYAVFVPCYNAAATIRETLESVQAAIFHTTVSIPVFIYDDCSADESCTVTKNIIANKNNFFLIRNSFNQGERKTTNAAFHSFRNKYDWAFIIHADDIVKRDWLAVLIETIEKEDDHACFTVWSSYDVLHDDSRKIDPGDDSGAVLHEAGTTERVRGIITKMYSSWHISGAAINVSLFQGFDESLAQFGDTDFFARGLVAGYKHIYISRTLNLYRIKYGSVSSVSVNTNRDIQEILYLIKKYDGVLTPKDIACLHGIIRRLSFRRTVKCLINGNFPMAVSNFKHFAYTIIK